MKKCFKSGFVAAALAIALHAAVLAALAVRAPAHPPIQSPAFLVRLSPHQQSQGKVSASVTTNINVSPKSGQDSNAGNIKPDAKSPAPADISAKAEAGELEWGDWLPQLSNSPLPLLENLPLIGPPAYFPASELQQRPSPEAPVIIPFPDAPLGKQKATAILLLYISAEGIVESAEVDESELPVEFEQAAIMTFLQAKMRPGIKDGKAVPARMKIEVEFEAK